MKELVVGVGTILYAVAAWHLLRWAVDTSNWQWVFPLFVAAAVALYYAVTDRAERERGWQEVKEWPRHWATYFRWRR